MIPNWAFLTAEKAVSVHVPEKALTLLKYDARKWRIYFGVENPKLQLSNVGAYSIARPKMSQALIEFIRSFVDDLKNMVVTETHGGVGGFTMTLADFFKKVQAVEIADLHAKIIENNAAILKKSNVRVYHNNFADLLLKLKQDVIVCDPPWGGLAYHEKKNIRLGLNNVDIVYYINKLFEAKRCRLFVLLAPSNFDFNEFYRHLEPRLLGNVRICFTDPTKPHHFFIGISEK